ncbi:MAG TPA: hypothetical protein VEI83_13135 [Acidimicrobiales bacterium]|nr:hypothetical protein [Acidimicrobiales bacterium]
MLALVVTLTVVVVLLMVLVAGLLRSHADILRALHALGVGVGDPAGRPGATGAPSGPTPVTIGPPLPPERRSTTAPAVAGVTPGGDARALAVSGVERYTLLAFLSSGCSTCQGLWRAFASPGTLALPEGVRLVVVTKGPELEIAGEVAAKAPPGLQVVMSTEAWSDYEVPGSPFFVLVDGAAGRRVGEGVANHFHQVADLIRRAMVDARGPVEHTASTTHLDGPARESANDAALIRAGILPGDPSLYPRSLEDVFQGTAVRGAGGSPYQGTGR